jgi:4-hydroxy-2-oxoheptanedioate aldolase
LEGRIITERHLRSRILAREPLLGAFLTSPNPAAVEMLALESFDFVVVDTEHGNFGPESVETMIRTADGARIPAIVRVPNCHASAESNRALDCGAAGTLFPRADGIAPVRAAVEGAKYAPIGKRGLAGVRANRYGTVPFDHWVLEANEATTVVIQIETAGALNHLAEIASEKDVDVLFVGPNDLSQSLGVPGHYDDPRYRAAVERVGASAREHGKAAGIMLRTTDQIPALSALGYTVFTTSDRSLLAESARGWRGALARS